MIAAELEEVHVLVPEVLLGALILVACDLVENADIANVVRRVKLLLDLFQESFLVLCQVLVDDKGVGPLMQEVVGVDLG